VNKTLTAIIFMMLTSPWWYPLVRDFLLDAWAASEPPDPQEAPPRAAPLESSGPRPRRFQRRMVYSEQGAVWSKRRWVNPTWETGRRSYGKLAESLERNRRRGFGTRSPGGRWEGGFGTKGL